MKPIQIQLIAGGEMIGKLDLSPVQQLRLAAHAHVNNLALAPMVGLCIDFTVASEDQGPDVHPADEIELVEFAAKRLIEAR